MNYIEQENHRLKGVEVDLNRTKQNMIEE